MLATLQSIGERNQFILCTHSAEIISSSLEHSVVFVQPSSGDGHNQAIVVDKSSKDQEALSLLSQHLGVVSLGRKIVFIEGENSSTDINIYRRLLANIPDCDLTLVPAGGAETIEKFATAVKSVIGRSIWGIDFFYLCDGDSYVSEDSAASITKKTVGSFQRLPRYHIENYLLNPEILSEAIAQLLPNETGSAEIEILESMLKAIAMDQLSHAVALIVSARLRRSVGNFSLSLKETTSLGEEDLLETLAKRMKDELEKINGKASIEVLEMEISSEFSSLEQSLKDGTDLWKKLVPGRNILKTLAGKFGLSFTDLRDAAIDVALNGESEHLEEIREILLGFQSQTWRL